MTLTIKDVLDYKNTEGKDIAPKGKWNGTWPANCDLCDAVLEDEKVFYDARTVSGHWGLLCARCFKVFGIGLGTGRGQKYDTKTLKKLEG